MSENRLNVRIEGAMSDHVDAVINSGLYSNQSEYVRDLIRHDMAGKYGAEHPPVSALQQEIISSYASLSKGEFSEKTTDEVFDEALEELKAENFKIAD